MPTKSSKSDHKGALKRRTGLKAATPTTKSATIRRKSSTAKSGFINARVQPKLKKEAERVFEQIGVSTSEAVTVFLKQVVLQRGLPFPVRIPNAETVAALRELERGGGVRFDTLDGLWNDLLKPD